MVGGVCKVIFVSNPTVVLCCVGVGVLTIFNLLFSKEIYIVQGHAGPYRIMLDGIGY